jgi:predicted esterase YcpF (UPF0227 family)
MILFVHGFGSCGWGEKSLALRRYFGIDRVLAPDLPFHPEEAVAHLRGMLERYSIHALIGSSLGGFYATALNAHAPRPTVLINPVVRPHELLQDHLGRKERWCDGAPFEVAPDHLADLRRLQRGRLAPNEHYLVLLQQGDEVLDYRRAADFYRAKDVMIQAGGSHRFEQFRHQLPRIAGWLRHELTAGRHDTPRGMDTLEKRR